MTHRVILAIAVPVLTLTSCDFFTETAFPDYLNRIEREISVSEWYTTSGEVWLSASADVRDRRLFVSIDEGGPESRIHVYDPNLELERVFTAVELRGSESAAVESTGLGSRAGFDFAARPVVGNFVFDVDPETGDLSRARDTTDADGALSDPYVEIAGRFEGDSPSIFRTYTFSVEIVEGWAELFVDAYDETFSRRESESTAVRVATRDTYFELLEAVAVWEGNQQDSFFLFLIGEPDRETLHIVSVSYFEFPEDAPALRGALESGSLFDAAWEGEGYFRFEIDNVDGSRGFLTADGIVTVSEDRDELRLHSYDGGEVEARLDIGDADHLDIAVPLEGESFYLLDTDRETLFQVANFW